MMTSHPLCLFADSRYPASMNNSAHPISINRFLCLGGLLCLGGFALAFLINVLIASTPSFAAPRGDIVTTAKDVQRHSTIAEESETALDDPSCELFRFSSEEGTSQGKRLSNPDSYLKEVQRRYQLLRTISARFEQRSYLKSLDLEEHSSGSLRLQMPGKLFWEYQEPEAQTFLIASNEFQLYQPVDQQLVLQSVEASFVSDIPVSFLFGIGNLQERFAITDACKGNDIISLQLRPKLKEANTAGNNLSQLTITFDTQNYFPAITEVVDGEGNRTTVKIFERNIGVTFEPTDFQIQVPKGTDIQDLRKKTTGE
jgi:outer membrane lipoprotein-sorting protein